MSNTQSKIDSLQELNSQLIATIAGLRRENAEVKAENTKLKQDKEEVEARIVGLEQTTKENAELKARVAKLEQTAEENTELKARVAKLEQKQLQNDISSNTNTPGNQAQDLSQFHEITSRDMESQPQVNHNTKIAFSIEKDYQSHVISENSESLEETVTNLSRSDHVYTNTSKVSGLE
ncbi:5760_t:CDS:2 [Entrophospora sp. SA101]|nr:5760_t:CDS:2 [Entrophospora sp. SA101]